MVSSWLATMRRFVTSHRMCTQSPQFSLPLQNCHTGMIYMKIQCVQKVCFLDNVWHASSSMCVTVTLGKGWGWVRWYVIYRWSQYELCGHLFWVESQMYNGPLPTPTCVPSSISREGPFTHQALLNLYIPRPLTKVIKSIPFLRHHCVII